MVYLDLYDWKSATFALTLIFSVSLFHITVPSLTLDKVTSRATNTKSSAFLQGAIQSGIVYIL